MRTRHPPPPAACPTALASRTQILPAADSPNRRTHCAPLVRISATASSRSAEVSCRNADGRTPAICNSGNRSFNSVFSALSICESPPNKKIGKCSCSRGGKVLASGLDHTPDPPTLRRATTKMPNAPAGHRVRADRIDRPISVGRIQHACHHAVYSDADAAIGRCSWAAVIMRATAAS